MSESTGGDLERKLTVLGRWHEAHGGDMTDFGGFWMPVHYGKGKTRTSKQDNPIFTEHLQARRRIVEFDVSHMGRYDLVGTDAIPFAQYVSTNNAAALEDGQGQYILLSDVRGIALDDAYLYRLGKDHLRLVVNAGNRLKDWNRLMAHKGSFPNVTLVDRSEELAMVSLQGPESSLILADLVGARNLPDKKNKFALVELHGKQVMVAKTGYTGEAKGYELILPAEIAPEVWERLIDEFHVTAAGLGARDSLRTEAGYPLYGHEFSDVPGREIPILANNTARIGISFAPVKRDYLGREALDGQMTESEHIMRGRYDLLPSDGKLKRIVRPILVENLNPSRSLRPGYRIFFGDQEVGVVTSGVFAPYLKFTGDEPDSVPTDQTGIRSIGLAMLDVRPDLRFNQHEPIKLRIVEQNGKDRPDLDSILLDTHLRTAAPWSRPVVSFPYPRETPIADDSSSATKVADYVKPFFNYQRRRQEERLLMVPSVIITAPLQALVATMLRGIYAEHRSLFGPSAEDTLFYPSTEPILVAERRVEGEYLKWVSRLRGEYQRSFGPQVEVRPISGQQGNSIVFEAIYKYKNRGYRKGTPPKKLRAIVNDIAYGGHLSSQVMGAMGPHVEKDSVTERYAVDFFPVMKENPYQIDVAETIKLIEKFKPDALVFGKSMIIGREPVKEISDALDQMYGRGNPDRPILVYDAAHVLGLLGPHFQNPFLEGIDLVVASTHKTWPGPERGVILGNLRKGSVMEELWRYIVDTTFPGHVSDHHPASLVASYIDAIEMNAHGEAYAKKVIENTKAFAKAAHLLRLGVIGGAADDMTVTHQVLFNMGYAQGYHFQKALQRNGIDANAQGIEGESFLEASGTRTGTNVMTKYGAEPPHFEQIAQFFRDVKDGRNGVMDAVRPFRRANNLIAPRFGIPIEVARPLAEEAVSVIMAPYR